jgi:HEAT repeat protein
VCNEVAINSQAISGKKRMMKATRATLALFQIVGVVLMMGCGPAQPSKEPLKEKAPPPPPADLPEHIRLLHSPDPEERARAAFRLSDRAQWAASGVPDLVALLGDESRVQWTPHGGHTSPGEEAARALKAIGEPAVEAVIAALADKDRRARLRAAQVLRELKDSRSVEPLISLLVHEEAEVRREAALALGAIADRSAAPALIACLEEEDWHLRALAAQSLGRIGDPRAVAPLLALLKKEPDTIRTSSGWGVAPAAMGALYAIGKAAVEPLHEALQDEDLLFRRRAVRILGVIGDPRSVDAFLAAMRDPDPTVRAWTALALGGSDDHMAVGMFVRPFSIDGGTPIHVLSRGLQDPRVVPSLVAALKDEAESVRQAAIRALGHTRDPAAVRPLIGAINDPDSGPWLPAAHALANRGDPRAVRPLIRALTSTSTDSQNRAARALGRLKDRRAVEPLLAALDHPKLAKAAASALGEIADPRAVKPLLAALHHTTSDFAFEAAKALGKMNDPHSVAPLIAHLQDPSSPLRRTATYALSTMSDPRALEPLVAALKDPDIAIRGYAAQGLGAIRDPRAVEPLTAVLLSPALDYNERWVRKCAAESLGKIGDPCAVEPLLIALEQERLDFRARVAEALRNITGADLEPNPFVWQQWWQENKESFSTGN